MPNAAERRRENLARLLRARYDGSQARLAAAVDRAPTLIWRLLTTGKHQRDMGEELARHIESATGMPRYWLDGVEQIVQPIGIGNVAEGQIGRRRVPVISYVQAGDPEEAVDAFAEGAGLDEMLTDQELGPHAFALEVLGESMSPEYREGDRIIVDPAVYPRPGDAVVAKVNGEVTFKRYRPRGVNASGGDVFELAPLNPDYATIRSDQPGYDVAIVGTVMEHRRYRKR